ncbi:3-hydroxybutyrate dehydrogenase [Devosia sp.]|uniref:3-hydroxybutyrate dehydrogenase n=1 Tax=Devosia sp. TaxID=1871048 RepID=UPI002EDF57DA
MRDRPRRRALVTGSTSGIGLAIARRLAQDGVHVVAHGLGSAQENAAALRDIGEAAGGGAAEFVEADLRDRHAIARLMQDLNDGGGLDILVNNAGMQRVAAIDRFVPEDWDDMLAVNLSAAFHTIRLALPGMRARGWGRIVNIASVSGLVAAAGKAPYAATKHGLVGLTKAVALETAREPVTCNAVCPGWVLTPLVERQIQSLASGEGLSRDAAAARLLGAKQPSQAFVRAEDVAAVVSFLCSDAAGEVRGAAWNIDGGYVAA